MHSKIKIYPSDTGYDLAATHYDDKQKYLNSFEKGRVLPLLGYVNGKSILDVGAGTGRLAIDLIKQNALVTALDVSAEMLNELKKKIKNYSKASHLKTIVGDAESLPFDSDSFDFVVAAFLIVHLKDPRRFCDEAYRVLKPGGRLVVTNINQTDPPEIKTKSGLIKIESYYHRPERIKEILEELAFGIRQEIFIKEKDVWVNQLIVASK